MIQVSSTCQLQQKFNVFLIYDISSISVFYLHNYYTGNIDIKNDMTTIQSSSTSMSADTFGNITKKRRMNELDELNEKKQETESSKVY